MSKRLACILLLFALMAGGAVSSFSEVRFGIDGSLFVPKYYDTFLSNSLQGYSYEGFYRVAEFGAIEGYAKFEQTRVTFNYPTQDNMGVQFDDTIISAYGKYSFFPTEEASYYLFGEAGLSIHNMTETILKDGVKQAASDLAADVQPYSYSGKILPGLYIAFGANQPILLGFSAYAKLGFEAIFAGSDFNFMPNKTGMQVTPQVKIGIQYAFQLGG